MVTSSMNVLGFYKVELFFSPEASKFTVRMVYHASFPNCKCILEIKVCFFRVECPYM